MACMALAKHFDPQTHVERTHDQMRGRSHQNALWRATMHCCGSGGNAHHYRHHTTTAAAAVVMAAMRAPQAKLFDGSPIWLLTKMKDVKEVLADTRFSKVGATHCTRCTPARAVYLAPTDAHLQRQVLGWRWRMQHMLPARCRRNTAAIWGRRISCACSPAAASLSHQQTLLTVRSPRAACTLANAAWDLGPHPPRVP